MPARLLFVALTGHVPGVNMRGDHLERDPVRHRVRCGQLCARPAQREMLFDLDTARRTIFARDGRSAEFDLISKSVANLIRMWADD